MVLLPEGMAFHRHVACGDFLETMGIPHTYIIYTYTRVSSYKSATVEHDVSI